MTSTSNLEASGPWSPAAGIGAAIVRRPASQGAAVAVTQDGCLGATYELGGRPFTLAALSATISDVLGTHLTYQDISVSGHNGVLTDSGLPPEMAAADADAGLARGESYAASYDLERR
jgi:NAD(P)H dehydrogenase (quinone)